MPDVTVGVVGKPLGLGGEVYVHPDRDLAEVFPPGRTYRAGDRRLTVADSRVHGNRRVVRFDGVTGREAAEELRGLTLALAREQVTLEDDALWADDLLGRPVRTPGGGQVGTIAGVTDGTAHDYLVVALPDGREVLVPAVDDLVEIAEDHVLVEPLPGLLGDEEA